MRPRVGQDVHRLGDAIPEGGGEEQAAAVERIVIARQQVDRNPEGAERVECARQRTALHVVRFEHVPAHHCEVTARVVRQGRESTHGVEAGLREACPGLFPQETPRHPELPIARVKKPDQLDPPTPLAQGQP